MSHWFFSIRTRSPIGCLKNVQHWHPSAGNGIDLMGFRVLVRSPAHMGDLTCTQIPIIKTRWSHTCLISTMGILIPRKTVFILKLGLGIFHAAIMLKHCNVYLILRDPTTFEILVGMDQPGANVFMAHIAEDGHADSQDLQYATQQLELDMGWWYMKSDIFIFVIIKIGSGNGLVPSGNKSLHGSKQNKRIKYYMPNIN